MKKLLAIVLVLFSVNCFANWTFVSTNDDNSIKTYLDFSTIKTVGGFKRVWSLMDFSKPKDNISSFKVLEEFDCRGEKRRTIQISAYSGRMGSGNTLGTENGNGQWSYVAPGTIEMGTFRKICK
jgi:hypothetical protein